MSFTGDENKEEAMKKYIGLIAILFLIPSLGIAGDEIINGVLQEAGGSYDGTGVDTIVAGTSIAVPSGFTATTAGAQAKALTVTGVSLFSDGSATAPGIAFSGDTDLGFYRDGAVIWVSVGGSGKYRFGTNYFQGGSPSGPRMADVTLSGTTPGFTSGNDPTSGLSALVGTVNLIATSETVYTATTTATSIGNAYSVSVDATNHALAIDQYGQVGKDPCTVEAKADLGAITDEQAAALFDQLRPFIGEYRKRVPVFETKIETDEKGIEKPVQVQTGWKYLEEGSGVIEPMMYESEMPVLNGKRLPYKDRVLIAIMAAKIRVMEKTQADILKRLEALEAK